MTVSKLDLVLIAAVASALVWIEHAHRISINLPAQAAARALAESVCPDEDSVPFSAECLAFIRGSTLPLTQTPRE